MKINQENNYCLKNFCFRDQLVNCTTLFINKTWITKFMSIKLLLSEKLILGKNNEINIISKQMAVLFEAGAEYVELINKNGRTEGTLCTKEIPLNEEKKEMLSMGLRLQYSMQKDFDSEFGTVNYTITERQHSRFVSIPISAGILLAKLDKSIDPFAYIKKVMGTLNSIKLSKKEIREYH